MEALNAAGSPRRRGQRAPTRWIDRSEGGLRNVDVFVWLDSGVARGAPVRLEA